MQNEDPVERDDGAQSVRIFSNNGNFVCEQRTYALLPAVFDRQTLGRLSQKSSHQSCDEPQSAKLSFNAFDEIRTHSQQKM